MPTQHRAGQPKHILNSAASRYWAISVRSLCFKQWIGDHCLQILQRGFLPFVVSQASCYVNCQIFSSPEVQCLIEHQLHLFIHQIFKLPASYGTWLKC